MTISGLLNGTVERPALKWLRTEYFNSTVNKGPRAFWTTTASGLKVDFSASKSWDFDGTIASYSWALGDGSTSTSATPSKTYSVAGNYTVSLTVTDNQGLTNTFSDLLTVSGSSAVTTDWTKPIGYCKDKFVGSTIKNNYLSPNWDRYWNQATPEYLGKWTSVEATKDQMDWSGLDFAWNYTKQKGLLFKSHTLVWGQQIPSWVAGLSTVDQALQVEQWIKLYCQRYPDYQLIDVVNEPIHETPNYINAIGGAGTTGWDWVVWSFQKARQYCPNAKLLINEYDVLNNDTNLAKYIQIINILKAKNLIDGIGEQGHHFETTTVTQLMNNLNTLAATSLPIYISELDFNLSDNTQHLNRMKQIVPMFYEHSSVKGITLWGYVKGETAQTGSWLYDSAASSGASTTTVTCATQNLQSNIPLALGVWNDYTVSIPTPGKIRAFFANDGAINSETMAVDYAIIDGVKYEAENQPINTAVWNGVSCGGQYSEMLHCSGYIEFPSGSSSVTIRAKAVDKGS